MPKAARFLCAQLPITLILLFALGYLFCGLVLGLTMLTPGLWKNLLVAVLGLTIYADFLAIQNVYVFEPSTREQLCFFGGLLIALGGLGFVNPPYELQSALLFSFEVGCLLLVGSGIFIVWKAQ